MPSLLPRPTRLSATDLPFAVFLATVGLCLFRAADLPSLDVSRGGTQVSIGPADLALLVTAALAARQLWNRRTVPSPWLLGATAAFALLIVVSAIPNGADALSAAGKLALLSVLALGAAAFVDTRARFAALATFLVSFCVVATAWGAIEFVIDGGKRQGSFMGEHDLAALATMVLVFGLAHVFGSVRRPPTVALVGIGVGTIGIVLGASLASVLGLYIGAAAMVGLALGRRDLRRRAVVATLVICTAVTAGTYGVRSADLGFLRAWFGPPPETPGQYAASWSQRLIFVYIGGRVFLDHPVLGTGWEGELPPSDYAQYLPDARRRYSDQPAHYFPQEDETFIPQQTYDQVLYQLGLVGAALFLVLAALAIRGSVIAGRGLRAGERWAEQAFVPVAWLSAMGGAIAGAALFGGSPLAALFWLTLGVVAAAAVLRESA
jgi:O-antigen ligase/polysaccharide polymerase Wzy-like membrane protein